MSKRKSIGETHVDGPRPDNGEAGAEPLEELSNEQINADLLEAVEAEKARAEEEHARYLRALADFANYKKRVNEREHQLRQFATRELILKLLPIIDDFERALAAASESQSFEALHDGLQMTLKKLLGALQAEGVEPIASEGQEFDPTLHEAVMRIEDSEHPENTVVHEIQKGYKLSSEVIRPARVAVAVSTDGE